MSTTPTSKTESKRISPADEAMPYEEPQAQEVSVFRGDGEIDYEALIDAPIGALKYVPRSR